MRSFALVAEGITDQVSLEAILYEHYDMDLDVQYLQPVRDATDESRQGAYGGWERVLEYCTMPDFKNAFQFNDYLIIQIDTDCCDHVNFGVPLTSEGTDRSDEHIVADTISVIISKIGHDIYEQFQERIIFAVAVHSLECWFLPFFASTKTAKSKSKSCATTLSHLVNKTGMQYHKDSQTYLHLVKNFKTKDAIEVCRKLQASFNIFIESLPEIRAESQTD